MRLAGPPTARLAFWLGTTLWIALPIAALALVARSEPPGAVRAPSVRWATVGRSTQPTNELVTLRFTHGPAAGLVAHPSLSGTVQRVELAAGQRLVTGHQALLVDNVWRVVTSIGPFPRPLRPADAGQDVRDLNDLLRTLDLPAGGGERFTADTGRGVVAFAELIGAGPPSQFDPAWTLFLPAEGAAVDQVQVQAGTAIPGGEPLATLQPPLLSVTIAPTDSGGAGSAPTLRLTADAKLMVAGRDLGSLRAKTVLPSETTDPTLLAALSAVAPAEDGEEIEGVVVTPPPKGAVNVPVAAVYADANASSCILWRAAPSRAVRRVEVGIVDATGDLAQITGLPAEATAVLIDPPRERRRPC